MAAENVQEEVSKGICASRRHGGSTTLPPWNTSYWYSKILASTSTPV